ncbi:hypothetical protein [Mucilaginibacter sp. AK015]|uniref:hypothetical protein n=1 Tax=Mucilaginibacter sp. AK015 TaxID=2723072 RepID=UPI0016157E9B|nr:hypothetical protein [Mucilaginibacter sp. AK015]MBB5396718.1 hypothetical protein [Mucilaginibacter sp. AK015]
MKYLEYLTYAVPVVFMVLSRLSLHRYKKLKDSGRVPEIVCARQKQNLFLFLAITTAMIIVIIQLQLFDL